MDDSKTTFGHKLYQPKPNETGQRILPSRGTTTGSIFAPMQLERRILVAVLPFVALAFVGVWISMMIKGAATWVESYATAPVGFLLAITALWAWKCRPRDVWKPRAVLLAALCGYFSLRLGVGLWITAHEGYRIGVMRDVFPPMVITSLFCVFLIPGRKGAMWALLLVPRCFMWKRRGQFSSLGA